MSARRWTRRVAGGGALLALAATVLAAAPRPAAAQTTPAPAATVRVGQGTGASFAVGAAVSVPVIVDFALGSTLKLGSLSVRVTWDSTRLALEGVDDGSAGSVFVGAARAGERRLSFLDAAGVGTTFTLATLRFRALAGTSGSTTVGVSVLGAGNEVGTNVLSRVRAGSAYPVCSSDANGDMLGDVTGDGKIDVLDAQLVARFAVGLTVSDSTRVRRLGDVTGDGTVDIVDAQQIARYTVGLVASTRVGQATAGACVLLTYRVVLLSPSSQTVTVGSPVDIRARVVDGSGLPVPDVTVTWDEPGTEPVSQKTSADGEVATRRTPDKEGTVSGVAYLGGKNDGTPRAPYSYVAASATAAPDQFLLDLQWVGGIPDPVRAAGEEARAILERVIRQPIVRFNETTTVSEVRDCESWITTAFTGTIRGVVLYVTVTGIDGRGGTIARAGPCLIQRATSMPAFSTMEVDAADWEGFDPALLRQVLLHEIMHAVGVGTVDGWDALVKDGTTNDPSFTGVTAFFGWQSARGVPFYAGAEVGHKLPSRRLQ
jgi:hypothetical protein